MDPISAAASIAGLLTAVGKIYCLLDFISSVRNSPATIRDAKNEVRHTELALRSLDEYLNSLASLNPKRTALIQVDALRVTLADAMMAFSDFETFLLSLANIARVKVVIVWPKYAKHIEEHMAKVQRYKSSLAFMLNILQSETHLEALQNQDRLQASIESTIQGNKLLRQMMNESQDSFDVQSMLTKRQGDDRSPIWTGDDDEDDTETIRESVQSGSHNDLSENAHRSRMLSPPFERILEQSWVYNRNRRNECDCSFISSERSHAWSVFSGFSLAGVSVLSVIAMPLTTVDLANGRYYQGKTGDEHLTPPFGDFDESIRPKSPTNPGVPILGNLGLEDSRLALPAKEEEPGDWMSESDYEMEDEEADGMNNNKPEDGVEDRIGELYKCTVCEEPLEEDQAFELGGRCWHTDCYRCNTCSCVLDPDDRMMLQGDGTIICTDCSYSCVDCGSKIEDMAVVLGPDTAVCPSCFVCFLCKERIRDLRYARSAKGIACMPCYEVMMAKRARRKAILPPAA